LQQSTHCIHARPLSATQYPSVACSPDTLARVAAALPARCGGRRAARPVRRARPSACAQRQTRRCVTGVPPWGGWQRDQRQRRSCACGSLDDDRVISAPHPDRTVRAPIRRHVHGLAATLRANEAAASRDRGKLHIIGKPERREGEGLRVKASRVRASDEQAFEMRDRRRMRLHRHRSDHVQSQSATAPINILPSGVT